MILNFNYTNTLSKYFSNSYHQVINIHGQLNDDDNPIIFGYAANNDHSRQLIQEEDVEFMKNIKKHNYKRKESFNQLKRYLMDDNDEVSVFIFGHSCGMSDNLILEEILNDKVVDSIRFFYHENHESYFNGQVNIDRIMDNDDNFKKLVSYDLSSRMPQVGEGKDKNDSFTQYIDSILN